MTLTKSRPRHSRFPLLEFLEDRLNPAPPLLQTIEGINFDEDAANSGFFHIPPDPYGAAGSTHVVSVVNTSIEFHQISDGAQQLSQQLATFFSALSPANDLFDPKVIYDQFENRFIVVALEEVDSPATSRILLAVSDDSDPNGTWRRVAINSVVSISGQNTWADYPGLAVDEEAVYVTSNMFRFSDGAGQGVRLWILNKGVSGGWYSGGSPGISGALNPYALAGFGVTSMPAQIYGTAPSGSTGTFLASYSGISGGGIESVQVVRVDNPLGTPTFTQQLVTVGNIDNTAAAIPRGSQSGTSTTIDAGDRRVYNAVWRNNQLYFATTINPSSGTDAGQATAHWFRVDTTNLALLTIADQGNVGGEDIASGVHTFYPNVGVDIDGSMAIGFAASGSSIFAGAYYTGRRASDTAGTVQSTGTLAAGVASYVRTFGGDNRWGDYSGLSLAPDGRTFWVFNEYAMAQGTPISGENGRWATRWGRFAFNTPPRVTTPISDVTVDEDASPTDINLNPHFEDDEDPDSALTYSVVGNTNTSLVATSFPSANNLRLAFAANANGTATITVRATDTFGAWVEDAFLVTVNAINDAPVLDNGGDMAVTAILEDETASAGTKISDIIASAGGDRITDADAGASEGLAITYADTADGHWEYSLNNGTNWFALGAVTATNARLLAADTNTRVRFVPNADFNGTLASALTFRAWDRTGGANGDLTNPNPNGNTTAYSTATETASLVVMAVNDVPSFTKGGDQTVLEDAGLQSVSNWATNISAGPANESTQTLTFLVSNDNSGLFSSQPAVSASGTLTYTPAANANGSAVVTLRLQDSGGIANGGVDTSAAQTITITVTAVNDAPGFANGADPTVDEDAGAQTVTNWATNIVAGPADESGQTLTFEASNNNNALFASQPVVSPAGTLTYTPAANANGVATVTLRLKDNGGTANGGADTSADQTFPITVIAVNDVPSFVIGASQTVDEDAGPQTVSNWATAIIKGPADEGVQTLTFLVTTDNDAMFSALPSIDDMGTLTFTPAADANGVATVTVRLRDSGGTANGGVDTSAAQTFTIAVTAVNDAPSFTKGADQMVDEDAGAQGVSNWATNIVAGPANESGQTLTFLMSTNNDALFSVLPIVNDAGLLTYTPAANANGSALITVRLHDDGGVANGGIDTSDPQTFAININAVNDSPSFVKGGDLTVIEDAGPQSFAQWATNISAGPADESGQTLTWLISTDYDALFTDLPAIAADGTLTFTAVANAHGTATVTARLRDNGGGQDTSPAQTFTIDVSGENDAPILDPSGSPVLTPIPRNSAQPLGDTVASFVGASISDIDGAALEGIAIVATAGSGTWQYSLDGGQTWTPVGGVDVNTARLLRDSDRLRFVPAAGFVGTVSFSYHAWDRTAGSAGGTADLAATGGASAFSSASETASLKTAVTLAAVPEDTRSPKGDTTASFAGAYINDPDAKAKKGMAVIGVTGSANGVWQYSINGGRTWKPLAGVSPSQAILLRDVNKVRFVPGAEFQGDAIIHYHAWDQTSGKAGSVVDLTLANATGAGTAFSAARDLAFVQVTSVNDAPRLDVSGEPPLTRVAPGTTNPAGDLVGAILGTSATDADGDTLGIAITAATGKGTWQYQPDGAATWTDLGKVSGKLPRKLAALDRVRFVPATGFTGIAKLIYRAWDGSLVSKVAETGLLRVTTDPAGPANTAPVLDTSPSPTLTSVPEDTKSPRGDTVASLLGTAMTDVDAGAVEGIAVTGVNSAGVGTWQYSINGGKTWKAIGLVSESSALLLRDTDRVRFLPTKNASGSASLTYRAWDRTRGAAGARANPTVTGAPGGASAFSIASESADVTVTPVNDAPVLNTKPSPMLTSILPGATDPAGDLVAALLGTAASDVDGDAIGIAVTAATGTGNWEFQVNGTGAWSAMIAPSLLSAADRVRFVPDAGFAGIAKLSYKASDGALTSKATETATLTVNAIEDRPRLNTRGTPILTPVAAGDTNPAGDLVSSLLGSFATDVDPNADLGIAITSAGLGGTWQIDTGSGWQNLGAVSAKSPMRLRGTDRIRFVPATGFVGIAKLMYKAWDASSADPNSPQSLSAATETATVTVNTAPVLIV